MSELKARLLGQTMNEYGCDTKIYLKSEADKVIAHHKYKRCLAMAKYCELREDEFGGDFAKRWLKRWLALAAEPTWAKFLQLIHKEEK